MLTDIEPISSFRFRRGSFAEYIGPGAFWGSVNLKQSGSGTCVQVTTQIEMSALVATLKQYFSPHKMETLFQNTTAVFTEEARKKYDDAM